MKILIEKQPDEFKGLARKSTDLKEKIKAHREALSMYPTDLLIMSELAACLIGYGDTEEEQSKNTEEACSLAKQVLESSPCVETILQANKTLCQALWIKGEKEEARKVAEQLPSVYRFCKYTENYILAPMQMGEIDEVTGEDKGLESLQWLAKSISSELATINTILMGMKGFSDDRKIRALKCNIATWHLYHDNYWNAGDDLAELHMDLAELLIKKGEIEEAFDNLDIAADRYYKNRHSWRLGPRAIARIQTDANGVYGSVMDHERMKKLLNKLDQCSTRWVDEFLNRAERALKSNNMNEAFTYLESARRCCQGDTEEPHPHKVSLSARLAEQIRSDSNGVFSEHMNDERMIELMNKLDHSNA